MCNSCILNQGSSAAVEAKARYSASVELLEIVGCFLAAQVIGLDPRKAMKPVVLCLALGSPVQSPSKKAERKMEPGLRRILEVSVRLSYLRIRSAA